MAIDQESWETPTPRLPSSRPPRLQSPPASTPPPIVYAFPTPTIVTTMTTSTDWEQELKEARRIDQERQAKEEHQRLIRQEREEQRKAVLSRDLWSSIFYHGLLSMTLLPLLNRSKVRS